MLLGSKQTVKKCRYGVQIYRKVKSRFIKLLNGKLYRCKFVILFMLTTFGSPACEPYHMFVGCPTL